MRTRAAAILIQNDMVALIERQRSGRHYFSFPGGGLEESETPEQGVMREVYEELGIQVQVIRQVAEAWFRGKRQLHFLVEQVSGEFGTGTGEEFTAGYDELHGTYHPMWMPVSELLSQPVQPREVAALVKDAHVNGWPNEFVTIRIEEIRK